MNELDEGRGVYVLLALLSARARRKEHEERAQAFAAGINNVVGDPVDEGNLAVQAMFDDPIDGLKIGGYELTNLF